MDEGNARTTRFIQEIQKRGPKPRDGFGLFLRRVRLFVLASSSSPLRCRAHLSSRPSSLRVFACPSACGRRVFVRARAGVRPRRNLLSLTLRSAAAYKSPRCGEFNSKGRARAGLMKVFVRPALKRGWLRRTDTSTRTARARTRTVRTLTRTPEVWGARAATGSRGFSF